MVSYNHSIKPLYYKHCFDFGKFRRVGYNLWIKEDEVETNISSIVNSNIRKYELEEMIPSYEITREV